jgi:hypothetical protein
MATPTARITEVCRPAITPDGKRNSPDIEAAQRNAVGCGTRKVLARRAPNSVANEWLAAKEAH